MRTCRNCGQTGHDRRNCPTIIELKTSANSPPPAPPSTEQASALKPKRKGIGDDLDAETKEAIAWYLEKQYPGFAERMKNRPSILDEDE